MVMTERQFWCLVLEALDYIQAVCVMIFDWFGVLVPIGIVALIAPQIALLGSEVYAVLAIFAYVFFLVSALVLTGAIVVVRLTEALAARRAQEHAQAHNVGSRYSQHTGLYPDRS